MLDTVHVFVYFVVVGILNAKFQTNVRTHHESIHIGYHFVRPFNVQWFKCGGQHNIDRIVMMTLMTNKLNQFNTFRAKLSAVAAVLFWTAIQI